MLQRYVRFLQSARSDLAPGSVLSLGIAVILGLTLVSGGCDLGETPVAETDHVERAVLDPQFVRIQHQYSFRDLLDTFDGTLTKDLILDGTVTIPFWLTKAEQETLLVEFKREDFFGLPDTLFPVHGMYIDPNPSPDLIRVEAEGMDKTVVWMYPLDQTKPGNQAILRLAAAIRRIVEARQEYKELPEPKRGYL
jgi:hypothetical protein